jgi:carbonic anhydrase/acetyltransferase-like protein (isoleucine patch superfamily)
VYAYLIKLIWQIVVSAKRSFLSQDESIGHVLVFPCCEVGAAVAVGLVATMTFGCRSGRDGLLRCESCISPLQSSLSESEQPVSCAKSHLFGIGRHGLHEAAVVRSFLVVVLR